MGRRRKRAHKRPCRGCGAEVVSSGPGRPREWCDICVPPKRAAGRKHRERTLLAGELLRRFALYDAEPGRAAVTEAIHRLARAQGRTATRSALVDLAAAAFAWAETLAPAYDADEVRS